MTSIAGSDPMTGAPPAATIAIVGGGITGLTAAFRLVRQGLPVTLYEASGRLGGVIQSIRRDGYLAEFGPNSILETSPKITALIQDAGLADRRIYSDPAAENRYIVRGKRPVGMPVSPAGFFGTKLFSAGAKLRLLAEPFVRRAPADAEEDLAHFVLRRIGREFLDYAINPFVAGVYAGDPARLSVQHAFPKLAAIEQRYGSLILGQVLGARERKRRAEVSKQDAKKISFDEGLQVLTDTLRARLGEAVCLGTAVQSLEQSARGWTVKSKSASGETRREHRAVLLAAPAYKLAEIDVPALTAAGLGLATLGQIHYPPVASVVLGFRRSEVRHPLDGFGMLIPAVEGCKILGSLFSSSLFPNRAPAECVTLTSYIGGVRAPELALRNGDELVAMTVADLREILGITGQPTFQHHILYPKAIPQYEVGYGRFKDLMTQAEAKAPGLFFAGHYRDGISLGDSIVSGHNVADRLATFCRTA
jgi:oxygen-dependent protoporphyrinogen oxidase